MEEEFLRFISTTYVNREPKDVQVWGSEDPRCSRLSLHMVS